ncbi:MAG: methyltransferase domain-containing protein [Acetobacterales bacterium]
MTSWDPTQYLKFTDLRRRPAIDLLVQIPLESPRLVYDLGCGAGNVTRLLAERWPSAKVVGIDSSAEMLTKAREGKGGEKIRWEQVDMSTWSPDEPADVIYSNAALQWLPDHAGLVPRLVEGLVSGGALAVQMPRMTEAPTHRVQEEAAAAGPWRDRLVPSPRQLTDNPPSFYYDLLAPRTARLDIWQTEYLHVLEGANPVTEWVSGTSLRPYLDLLSDQEQQAFLGEYSSRIDKFYPPRADGRTLLPFRRLLMVAIR